MAKITSKLSPPKTNPCLSCKKIKLFMQEHNIENYDDYCKLTIGEINSFRTNCASCKGDVWSGFGSGSYKADLVAWWWLGAKEIIKTPKGKGKTSRFREEDIKMMKALHKKGVLTQEIGDIYGISRKSVSQLINGHVKKLRK